MRNVLTIFRRELTAYFTSPIGYIYMMVFVTISVGLYITTFFAFPVADMRAFFLNLPILLCVFIPAVTMRVWAEERKENTWEMLLTLPMNTWELVLGKFLAGLAFYTLSLAATVTLPVMLFQLGNPDPGAMASGYLGTLLLGALFLAIGIFFSGFFKDQIVAFVITLLACFTVYMVGTPFVESTINDYVRGLGSLLTELVGVTNHFGAFTRGVIEVADVLYFVAWTAVFLFLNIVYIEGRSRRGARSLFALTAAICLAIGFAGNWLIADASFGRFDVTEDKVFSVSDASENILSSLDTPVQVKLYITPRSEMPAGMNTLQQDIEDKLDELRVASNGMLNYQTIHLQVENVIASTGVFDEPEPEEEQDETKQREKTLEERMLDKGIEPFQVQAMSEDQFTNKLVYSSIGVAYKDKAEEIIPRVMPESIPELEYRLVSTIYKLTQPEAPVVALVAPTEAINIPPDLRRMYEQMGQKIPDTDDPYEYLQLFLEQEKYDVHRVALTADEPLPEDYDTLVVVNPREFNERQRWEINRALHSGKSVVLAVQNYEWDYRPTRQGITITRRDENPNVNPLLEHYGVTIDKDVLMDVNAVPLRVQSGGNSLAALLGGGTDIQLPFHMLVKSESMDDSTSITSRLPAVFYLWGTALNIDEAKLDENGLEAQPLMYTTDRAWTVDADTKATEAMFEEPETGRQAYPLMAMVTGQFPDAYAEQERPDWPAPPAEPGQPPAPQPEEPEAAPVEPAPGQLIVLGCSEMFRRDFIGTAGNVDLFLNSVDAVTLGSDIVNVRGQKPIDRLIDTPEPDVRQRWKFINYGLANSAIALVGIVVAVTRRVSRNRYTLAQAKAGDAAA